MKAEGIRNISVIGAGFIGPGIAQIFASKCYAVSLMDIKDELLPKAVENIRSNLSLMAMKGLLPESEIDAILGKIKTTTDMGEATSDVQLVIEAVTENLELKQKVFRDLDQLCPPETILATNTSVISITEIAAKARRQERIVGTHFWNPPYLIPLVEVVKGKKTSDEVLETTYQFLKSVGKYPVKVMKDVPGFIGNRLQHALWREAISIVENGIADPASVDDVIKKGFGMRLPIVGPLENADMIGLDLTLAIHNYILKYIDSSHKPSSLLREKVAREELGFKTGQGFQTWSAERISASRDRLLEYLIEWNKKEQGKNKS
jgi:3-hydroxybutyryl-CoA dehydrogenase